MMLRQDIIDSGILRFLPIEICENIWKIRMEPFIQKAKMLQNSLYFVNGHDSGLCPYSCCYVVTTGLGVYRYSSGKSPFSVLKLSSKKCKKRRYYTWISKDGSYNKFCYD